MATTTLYRIVDWDKHFELAQSRKAKRLSWVPMPNKHDGSGYTELLDHPNGPIHYACWVGIVQVASKCQPRGSLLRDGSQPHTSAVLARQTRIPAEWFDEAIPRLLAIGWLSAEPFETKGDTARSQPSGSELGDGSQPSGSALVAREEKRREEEKTEEDSTREKTRTSASADVCRARAPDIDAVVARWCEYHPQGRPGARERRKIADRLKEGYSVGDLKEAVDGCHKTPHNLGANEQDTKYLALELIMRNSDQVARFIENNRDPPRPRNEKERRVLEASERWLERMEKDGQLQP